MPPAGPSERGRPQSAATGRAPRAAGRLRAPRPGARRAYGVRRRAAIRSRNPPLRSRCSEIACSTMRSAHSGSDCRYRSMPRSQSVRRSLDGRRRKSRGLPPASTRGAESASRQPLSCRRVARSSSSRSGRGASDRHEVRRSAASAAWSFWVTTIQSRSGSSSTSPPTSARIMLAPLSAHRLAALGRNGMRPRRVLPVLRPHRCVAWPVGGRTPFRTALDLVPFCQALTFSPLTSLVGAKASTSRRSRQRAAIARKAPPRPAPDR